MPTFKIKKKKSSIPIILLDTSIPKIPSFCISNSIFKKTTLNGDIYNELCSSGNSVGLPFMIVIDMSDQDLYSTDRNITYNKVLYVSL